MRLKLMMKNLVFGILVLVLLSTISSAQVSNITVRVQWNPNSPSDNVTEYTLVVDGGAPIVVLPAACDVTVCEQAVTLTFASHTFSLTATNQWGTSAASVVTENLSIPGVVSNIRILR